jgi:hypothetical protein
VFTLLHIHTSTIGGKLKTTVPDIKLEKKKRIKILNQIKKKKPHVDNLATFVACRLLAPACGFELAPPPFTYRCCCVVSGMDPEIKLTD